MSDGYTLFMGIFYGLILIGIYFIPTVISLARGSTHSAAIFFINFFLGITLIGWVGVFVWAIIDENAHQRNKRLQKEAAELEATKQQQMALQQLMLQSMTQMQMVNKGTLQKEESVENTQCLEKYNE